MGQAVAKTLSQNKSLRGKFNARRGDNKNIQLGNEVAILERRMADNEKLAKCTIESLEAVLLDAAALKLTLHPSLAYAYPIPYYNSDKKQFEADLHVGYRGMEQVVYRAGTVRNIQTVLVRKNDPVFKVGTNENGRYIIHEEARKDRGDVTHAYSIADYVNGGRHIEVMDMADILQCEAAAKKRKGGGAVWDGPFREEMYKKCPVRRAYKHWPKDEAGEMAALMNVMDKNEPMFSETPQDVSAEPEVTITKDDELTLHAYLTDNGLSGELASAWLDKLASQMGLSTIGDLPNSNLDDVKKSLEGYLEQWKEAQGEN